LRGSDSSAIVAPRCRRRYKVRRLY
jgi:hypothetical protein